MHPRRDATGTLDGPAWQDAVWSSFAAAASDEERLQAWLSILAADLPQATSAILLLTRPDGSFAPAAVWPNAMIDGTRLGAATERALAQKRVSVQAEADGAVHIAYPIMREAEAEGAVVVALAAHPGAALKTVLRRIHWALGWLEARSADLLRHAGEAHATRSGAAVDILAALGDETGLDAALITLCNELAAKLACRRVSFGITHGDVMRLRAMSGQAWFKRRTALARAIETAMDEALAQNATLALPVLSDERRRLTLAHRRLAEAWTTGPLLTVLVASRGLPFGALTLERGDGTPFTRETIDLVEYVASAVEPVLRRESEAGRLFAGRVPQAIGRLAVKLVGRRHPALKAAALALAILIGGLAVAEGPFRVSARSSLEGSVQRAAVAPFAGFIGQAPVRAGDVVEEGQLMALLDDRDLRLERLKWESERQKLFQRQREALARADRPGVVVAAAQLAQVEADIALVEEKLARTRVVAPIAGVVVSGDLSQSLGSPIEQGKVLFEVAPLDSYRVVLQVAETDIRHVAVGQSGTVALAGATAEPIPLTVTNVTSVSTPLDGRNAFRVEAALGETSLSLRPGMEGIGKIDIGRTSLLWTWLRGTVERVRLFVWTWTP